MIYEKIKSLCDERGLSIRALEMRAGLGNGTIKGWKGSSPSVDKLHAVAKVLEVPLEYFVRD